MHPTLRIISLILLAVVIQFLDSWTLAIAGALLTALASILYGKSLCRMLRRSRWLLLTLLLIYAFSTPGEYLAWWPLDIAPTHEGIAQGALQTGRLVIMLVALAILLGTTARDALVAGIFHLIAPLRWTGLRPERFAARLWLTLHYVEAAPAQTRGSLWDSLDQFGRPGDAAQVEHIHFASPPFSRLDWLVAALAGCLAVGWWLA